jgi:hypothetical protein
MTGSQVNLLKAAGKCDIMRSVEFAATTALPQLDDTLFL